MTSRSQMDDIQYRLEVIREEYPAGKLQEWQLQELIDDCEQLRLEDPQGEFAEAQQFIAGMLKLVMKNLDATRRLRSLRMRLSG